MLLEVVGVPYKEAVRSLTYLALAARPDIMFVVAKISLFLSSPKLCHWMAVKRIIRCIYGTKNYGILYKSKNDDIPTLIGFSDADFVGDLPTRKSSTRYVFVSQNGAITWCSRKRRTVSLSTTEAEYIAARETAKEAIWIHNLNMELHNLKDGGITIFVDNQSVIRLAKNPEHHNGTKHIDVRYHIIPQQVEDSSIKINYMKSEDQLAGLYLLKV